MRQDSFKSKTPRLKLKSLQTFLAIKRFEGTKIGKVIKQSRSSKLRWAHICAHSRIPVNAISNPNPHERTLTGPGSWVYPKGRCSRVRPGWGRRYAPGLAPRGSLYEFVLYNSNKKFINCYKNHTVYEFVLHDLYNNCMNSFI